MKRRPRRASRAVGLLPDSSRITTAPPVCAPVRAPFPPTGCPRTVCAPVARRRVPRRTHPPPPPLRPPSSPPP